MRTALKAPKSRDLLTVNSNFSMAPRQRSTRDAHLRQRTRFVVRQQTCEYSDLFLERKFYVFALRISCCQAQRFEGIRWLLDCLLNVGWSPPDQNNDTDHGLHSTPNCSNLTFFSSSGTSARSVCSQMRFARPYQA